jgi:acyl-coenzyme A thioesterase PaaI-like protein
MPEAMMKQLIETKVAFIERSGIKAIELKPGYVKLSAPIKGNENHIGTMYAGALFTVAEMPVGAIYLTTFDINKYYPVVKEMTIQYRKLAKTDVTVELGFTDEEVAKILTETDETGKSEFNVQVDVKDESGEIVAIGKGIYQLRVIGR